MTAYEAGFDWGQRTAFADRRKGIVRCRPDGALDQRERGFWDGYEPRSESWRMSKVPDTAWWLEKEEA
jgi:hypothetical protein